ncbi:hypothetical protein NY057_05040 [Curtobacterium flaccumfaciens]|uniref:hypothetical protein n=1 Tax=Curtobacterium flaccumfaciens TaxID=2035 RepID=UPI0021FECB6A|nr:hypothetical protein [Curtobacterium flaccumfaciens]UWD83611.1 hypothetical protein NY057_05040 [Curtobacterium flaccumfaciens]
MRTAGLLLAASFVASWFASAVQYGSSLWVALVWVVVIAFVAALLRVHAVVNAPGSDE